MESMKKVGLSAAVAISGVLASGGVAHAGKMICDPAWYCNDDDAMCDCYVNSGACSTQDTAMYVQACQCVVYNACYSDQCWDSWDCDYSYGQTCGDHGMGHWTCGFSS